MQVSLDDGMARWLPERLSKNLVDEADNVVIAFFLLFAGFAGYRWIVSIPGFGWSYPVYLRC